MRFFLQPCVCILSLLGPLAVALPATADTAEDARALFKSGVADMEAGRYEQGCKAIADSQRLDPRLGTLYTLATCESRWGHVKTAAARFGAYLELYSKLTPTQQEGQGDRPRIAKETQEKLAAEIPELTLLLPPDAPAGTVVKLNNEVVAASALGVGQRMDPGDYVIFTQAPGGPVLEQRVTLNKQDKKNLVLEAKPAPPAVEPPKPKVEVPPPSAIPAPANPPVIAGTSGRQNVGYLVSGVGIAALLMGGVMGGLTLEQKSLISRHCGSAIKSKDVTECDQAGLDAASNARTLGLVSTVGFGTGLVGLGTGVVLLLAGPKSTPTTAGASRPWISAGVLSAGPAGAMMGTRGAW